jgi:hypothetical protein
MKAGMMISLVIWGGIVMFATGCSGIGLGHKLELYAIDDRKESHEVTSRSMPLKCRFVNCAGEAHANDK